MADSQRTMEAAQSQGTGHDLHDRVEVYEANGATATRQEAIHNTQGDAGFGNADLHNARVVTGDAEPTSFRTTDLRDTELNTTMTGNPTAIDASQGTNWGTILMVIAIILVIILLGSWLF